MSKVQSCHLQKPAYIYIRQSTMGQVRHHQESTERQYDLRNRAVEMMWAPERIRILDQDLGQSGAQTTNREDFKTLVADVSLGRVGAIFALEASRLARSNLEWHRLIEICALTRTLVIDEDGCYDPADFNDALLLGLKATIAQVGGFTGPGERLPALRPRPVVPEEVAQPRGHRRHHHRAVRR